MTELNYGEFLLPSATLLKSFYGSGQVDKEGSYNYGGVADPALDAAMAAMDAAITLESLRDAAHAFDRVFMQQKNHGTSYVFISHDLAVIRAVSRRIMVMKDGSVIEEAGSEALFARPQDRVHPRADPLRCARRRTGQPCVAMSAPEADALDCP